jgi:hypothetical protein
MRNIYEIFSIESEGMIWRRHDDTNKYLSGTDSTDCLLAAQAKLSDEHSRNISYSLTFRHVARTGEPHGTAVESAEGSCLNIYVTTLTVLTPERIWSGIETKQNYYLPRVEAG